MKSILWQNLTESEINRIISSGIKSVILPVGATEQHGPHLKTGTDSSIAEKLCHAASAQTQIPILPTLPYGCSLGHSHFWKGTLSLDPKVLIDVVTQIGQWAYANGIRKLFMINGHVSNAAPLRCALEILRSEKDDFQVAVLNTGMLNREIAQDFSADAQDWHANQAETSVMRYIDAEGVRPDLLAQSDDEDRTEACVFSHPVNKTSTNGVTGYPSRSSEEEGKLLWDKMVVALVDILEKGLKEDPPLNQPYHVL